MHNDILSFGPSEGDVLNFMVKSIVARLDILRCHSRLFVTRGTLPTTGVAVVAPDHKNTKITCYEVELNEPTPRATTMAAMRHRPNKPLSTLIWIFCLIALFAFEHAVGAYHGDAYDFYMKPTSQEGINCEACRQECSQTCPSRSIYHDLAFKIIKNIHTTAETALRSFALGFGARLLKFVLVDKEEELDRLRQRCLKAAVVGVSVASFVLGMSLFLPAKHRAMWFES